jgi:hypothetical protein
MPTRKQRRRQQKLRRHEWEEVWVDSEGHEVEVDEPPTPPKPLKTETAKRPTGARAASPRRVPQPPSWRRSLKRGALWGPGFVVILYLLKPKNASAASVIVQAIPLLILLIPFMYWVDRLAYRRYERMSGPKKTA